MTVYSRGDKKKAASTNCLSKNMQAVQMQPRLIGVIKSVLEKAIS